MNESNQQPQYPQQPQQPYYDDEIDLRDLVLTLIKGWRWIAGSVILAVALALAYVTVKTPVYETGFKAVAAPSTNFALLNAVNRGFSASPGDVHQALSNRLSSYQNAQVFLQENPGLIEVPENREPAELLLERTTIGPKEKDSEGASLTLDYRYPEGEQGPEVVNQYVEHTARDVWGRFVNRFQEYNQAHIARLEMDLALEKENLKRAREDRLFTLQQAIAVARRLGIEKPTTPQDFGRQPSDNEVIYANISGDGSLPLYFMGYQALEADKDTIQAAMNEGLSNGTIRGLEKELAQRKQATKLLEAEREKLASPDNTITYTDRVVDVVEHAYVPQQSSEPKKKLTLVLAILLGGMLGVMMVFIASFAASMKTRNNP